MIGQVHIKQLPNISLSINFQLHPAHVIVSKYLHIFVSVQTQQVFGGKFTRIPPSLHNLAMKHLDNW